MTSGVELFEQSTPLPVSADEAYAWHARPGAFERLTPPWDRTRVLERSGTIENGRVILELRLGPFPVRWVAQHLDAIPGRQFVDTELSGPFASWRHVHRFEPTSPTTCRHTDHIEFALPGGALGTLGVPRVRRDLERLLTCRHRTLRADLEAHARFAPYPRLHVAITGASGLIGRALVPFLTTGGHRVTLLTRRAPRTGELHWDPASGTIDATGLEGVDAVVHLAGENIGARWTPERKRRVLESRKQGTELIARTLAGLKRPPRVLLSASAVGIYGDGGDAILSESDGPPSAGRAAGRRPFAVEVGEVWEGSCEPARRAGIRVVNPRIGLVLTPRGGALARMLPPFRLGLGGPIGGGRQWMSWISIDDLVGTLHHALFADALAGPVNAVAPIPVTNADFTRILGRVLGRPAVFPVPAVALRLAFGQMADELLLSSSRASSAKLEESGYRFRHRTLEEALRQVLGK